jgi:hypothetical protein
MKKNNELKTDAAAAEAVQTPKLPDHIKNWLAIVKEAALEIDPETAEVIWDYAEEMDPYRIYPDLPEEFRGGVIRTLYFRSPWSDVCVWMGDLPNATRAALVEKYKADFALSSCYPTTEQLEQLRRIIELNESPSLKELMRLVTEQRFENRLFTPKEVVRLIIESNQQLNDNVTHT